jgi:hydrophobic/amphiphilic exporter-1 (mainly G- bacteria), HAE1 family
MSLTELSIKRPILIIVIFIVFAVLGIFSFFQLKYELVPDIAAPYATVIAIYPGASPKDVENSVTKRIEDAVSNADKIKRISSYSSEGVSMVMIEFMQDTNADNAVQDVQRRLNEINDSFPDGVRTPTISKFSLSDMPIIRTGVTSSLSERDFYQFVKEIVKPGLSRVKGVGQVTIIGGLEREIKVNINLDKISGYNLSILQVVQALKQSNMDFPAGNVKDEDGLYTIRVSGKFNNLDELRNLVITKNYKGDFIKLRDIADVEDGTKEITTISRINGKNSLGILVQKQSGTNAVEISKLVREELKKMEKDYKYNNIKFDIAQDSSVFTLEAAKSVGEDLLLAILLVGLVMLMFLHSIRNSLIVMVAIPCSLVTTLIGVYVLNFTLNLMTLLALSLIIGILVDDSIVVLENIYRHLEHGEERRIAALKGRNEIGFAALSITLVDVVVFLPLALTPGIVGQIVRQYSLVVVIATMISLFVSFTVTPMLASRFSKIEDLNRKSFLGKFGNKFETFFSKLTEVYSRILKWGLGNKKKVVLLSSILFVFSILLIPAGFIGTEFYSEVDRGELSVQVELPLRVNLSETNQISQKIEKILFKIPEVRKVFVNVGASSDGWVGQTSNNISELNVTLSPRSERNRSIYQVGKEINRKVKNIPGVKVRVTPINLFGAGESFPIGIAATGLNYDDVYAAAEKLEKIMKQIRGVGEVKMTTTEGKPEVKVEIDREKMASFGLTLDSVGSTLRVALTGDDSSKYSEGSNEYSIRILLDQFDRKKTSDIGKIKFMNLKGEQIELRQFSKIYQSLGPNQLRRQDKASSVMVMCQTTGRPSGDIGYDIKQAMKKTDFPKNVTFQDTGYTELQNDAFLSLGIALTIAILFVYLIMVALYNSFLYPLVVLFSVPVAIVGALLGLALTMKTLNIFSILGIIMLVGLVCKNAILIVDRANKNIENGMTDFDALIDAGRVRLRPIVMTTTAMIFGMLPIALAFGGGAAEIKSSLGIVLIGGLLSSMFLTLILVPVVYLTFEKIKARLRKKKLS